MLRMDRWTDRVKAKQKERKRNKIKGYLTDTVHIEFQIAVAPDEEKKKNTEGALVLPFNFLKSCNLA